MLSVIGYVFRATVENLEMCLERDAATLGLPDDGTRS